MNLRNKKTGEKGYLYANKDANYNVLDADDKVLAVYPSLAELSEDWEDAPDEERKEYWCIDWTGGVNKIIPLDSSHDKYEQSKKEIGNYFETEEEAEKAVEKLKAWRRLKDKGLKFERPYTMHDHIKYDVDTVTGELKVDRALKEDREIRADLDLLFGEEKGE